ncbi:MAG: transporter, partial [Desulfitobacterium hafniense]
ITFLLPLDCVPLITYGKGYYKMVDMVKAGIIPTIAVILVSAFILPPLGALIGL